ncbi:MAG: thioredoxin family protein [Symbiobacteriaceae bacterium]|nr:thioredoxin family protein [Symbiobacteriaceae bacterium]
MSFLPDVIMLGPVPLAAVALTGLAGGLLAYWLTGRAARRAGAAPDEAGAAQDIVPNLFVGGVLSAKLVYVLMDPGAYLANPGLLVVFPYGPLALPVGLAGGVAAVAWGLRRRKDWPRLLDYAAGPLATGLAAALLGWRAPGAWAFSPLVAAAAAASMLTGAGATTLQVAAAIVGTAAWLWARKQTSSGA